jgi:hypothetical protein
MGRSRRSNDRDLYFGMHAVGLTLLGNVHAVGLRADVSW